MVAMLNETFTVMFTVIYEVHDLLQVSNMFLSFYFSFLMYQDMLLILNHPDLC